MNTFTWTDDMVKDVCAQIAERYRFSGMYLKNYIYADIEKYKETKIQGTFENKVYWRVNLDNLCISPVSEIPPIEDGDLYFTTYPEAGNYVTKILTKNLFNNAQK